MGSADEHETALKAGQRLDRRRQVERREPWQRGRQTPDRGGRPPAFVMQIDAEPAEVRRAKRRIGDAGVAELLAGVGRQRGDHCFGDLLSVQGAVQERVNDAVHPDHWRGASDEEEVAAGTLHHLLEPRAKARRVFVGRRSARRDGVELGDQGVEVVGIGHDGSTRSGCRPVVS